MNLTHKNTPGSLRVVGEVDASRSTRNGTRKVIDRERDRALRAGTLNKLLLDTAPVRSKTEPSSGLAEDSKRVTPWLFRRVNAPVSPAPQTPSEVSPRRPEKAPADVIRFAKPPSYRAAQESFPSKDKSTGAQGTQEIGIMAKDSRAGTHRPQSPTRAPTGLAWPNKPNRTAGPSDAAPNLRQTGHEEERPRPGFADRHVTPPPTPAHPPRYRPREMSLTPSLPPYCVTGGSSTPSKEPWPQVRSRKPSSAAEPRLALPDHPLLPDSAVSRIRAAYRVSNELGNAVMLQEVRVATPVGCTRLDVASISRVKGRFVSVTEPEGKVNARVDRRLGERVHEARQRALSKPSDYGGRNHDGKIHRTASERVNPMKVRDVSRRQALRLEEVVIG